MRIRTWAIFLILAVVAAFVGVWQIWPASHEAPNRPYRIGIIHPSKVDLITVRGFKAQLAELGYVEGESVEFAYNGPVGHKSKLDAAAAELVGRDVDIIFVSSTPATQAVKKAAAPRRTPVVFGPVNDPVGAGLVDSLRNPGANITGVTLPASGGRRMQWLSDIAPTARRILVPFNPNDKSSLATLRQVKDGGQTRSLQAVEHVVRNNEDITLLINQFPEDVDAIFLPRDALITARIGDFVAVAIERGLPLSVPGYNQVEAGALYSYGFVHEEVGRRAAKLVDQILRGSAPSDLPVDRVDAHLYINLNTAKAIELEIPDHLLRQATSIVR